MSKRKTTEQFKQDVYNVHGDNVIVLGEYKNNREKILVKYRDCGHVELKNPTKLLAGHGCIACKNKRQAKSKTKDVEYYKKSLAENGIDYIEVLGEYKGCHEKILVRNLKCGHEYSANASNIRKGTGCPVCHGFKDTQKFKEQIEEKYPGEYVVVGEYINNKVPIRVRHKCGYEWDVIPKDLLREIRCPECMRSKGELIVGDYLTRTGVEFEKEYTFDDLKDKMKLKFDFAVNDGGKMKLIEFDGDQHFRESSRYYSEKMHKHDLMKNKYCIEKGIPLLRIPYWWARTDRVEKELDKFILNK